MAMNLTGFGEAWNFLPISAIVTHVFYVAGMKLGVDIEG
jgi:hypothetical protein